MGGLHPVPPPFHARVLWFCVLSTCWVMGGGGPRTTTLPAASLTLETTVLVLLTTILVLVTTVLELVTTVLVLAAYW